jgi:hypothetical protein
MIINNKKLYNNKCKDCAYRQGNNCDKPEWSIPKSDICIGFLHKSCSHLIKKSQKQFLDINSSWSKIIEEGSKNKEIFEQKTAQLLYPHTDREGHINFELFNSTINIAINKKSIEFYNEVPLFLYQCICGNFYFHSHCPSCNNNDLTKIEVDIEYLNGLIENFLESLNLTSTEDILKGIRILDINDINIYEGCLSHDCFHNCYINYLCCPSEMCCFLWVF